jgi:tRNA pseudouridine32 synthase/23S rRNA pseudouridine746 synthase
MKSISAPILGDGLYSRFDEARREERAYLHACAIYFKVADKEYWITDDPHGGKFDHPEFIQLWKSLGDLRNLNWTVDSKRKKSSS